MLASTRKFQQMYNLVKIVEFFKKQLNSKLKDSIYMTRSMKAHEIGMIRFEYSRAFENFSLMKYQLITIIITSFMDFDGVPMTLTGKHTIAFDFTNRKVFIQKSNMGWYGLLQTPSMHCFDVGIKLPMRCQQIQDYH